MPTVHCQMAKEKYLEALKRKFDNPLYIFDERLTGMVIGPFFAAAHYQPYEWNRRITGECNRAWGYVKETHGELEIRYFRGKGLLSPGWLLAVTLLCWGVLLLAELESDFGFGWLTLGISAACALVACTVTAIGSAMTEEGAAGVREVDKFLQDPENYFC